MDAGAVWWLALAWHLNALTRGSSETAIQERLAAQFGSYEHAYAIDFGAAHAKYIDAFFANVQWSEVEKRLARSDKALAALRT